MAFIIVFSAHVWYMMLQHRAFIFEIFIASFLVARRFCVLILSAFQSKLSIMQMYNFMI